MQTNRSAPTGATRKPSRQRPSRAAAPARQHLTLRRLALPELPRGEGRAHAPIIWLFLASHLGGSDRTVWPSNRRISECTGLSLRAVERGIAYLRDIGKLTITYDVRPTMAKQHRKRGRLIEMHLIGDGPNPVVHFPSPQIMAGIQRSCAAVRARPTALVALAVVEYVLAAAEQGGELTEATHVTAPIATVRSLVGAPHGSAFNRKLADLERAGLLARVAEHWRSGAIVKLPPRLLAIRPPIRLSPAPLQRVELQLAANDAATLDDMLALDAEVAAALGWRPQGMHAASG
jgi:hypothetical protein